jgi:hypothetical protein
VEFLNGIVEKYKGYNLLEPSAAAIVNWRPRNQRHSWLPIENIPDSDFPLKNYKCMTVFIWP